MKISIFYTNDIHCEYEPLAGLATYIFENMTANDLLFDGGDFCDLKSLLIQGTDGLAAIDIMKMMKYDAMVVGNNEIDLEHDKLSNLANHDFPILSCNITANDGSKIDHIIPSLIIEKANIRFLVIGVSPYYSINLTPNKYNTFFAMGNITTLEPVELIRQEIAKNQTKYDICILLSHSGFKAEEYILNQIPEIDLCLGGHSHTKVEELMRINKSYYLQTGKYAEGIGRIDLKISDRKIINISGKCLNNDFPLNLALINLLKSEEEIAIKAMDRPLYTIKPLAWNPYRESELINFICDALYFEYDCDFTMMHAGIVNSAIEGDISKLRLLKLSPSKLNPTRITLFGKQIIEAVKLSFDEQVIKQAGKGAGFRGDVLGTLGFSHNVKINAHTYEVFINDKKVENELRYVCVTDDYLQRGTGYHCLKVADQDAYFYHGFIRDLLERELNNPDCWKTCQLKRIID